MCAIKKVIWTFRLPVTKDETNIQRMRDDMMQMRMHETERKDGLPPSKRFFNVTSLTNHPIIQNPIKFPLEGLSSQVFFPSSHEL